MLLRSCLTLALLAAAMPALAVPLPQARPDEKTEKPAKEESPAPGKPGGDRKPETGDVDVVPLPEARPEQAKPAQPAVAKPAEEGPGPSPAEPDAKPAPSPEAAAPIPEAKPIEAAKLPEPDAICTALKASNEAEFDELPAILEGGCGAPFPISLKALTPKDQPRVVLDPPVVVRCETAKAAVDWLRDEVQPAARKTLGEPLAAWRSTNGYACRGRNRVKGAKLSEHARANAIDIGTFETASGKQIGVGSTDEPGLSFMLDIRAKACGPFKTVLGPGSDTFHATHFHLDTIKRGRDGKTTYCH